MGKVLLSLLLSLVCTRKIFLHALETNAFPQSVHFVVFFLFLRPFWHGFLHRFSSVFFTCAGSAILQKTGLNSLVITAHMWLSSILRTTSGRASCVLNSATFCSRRRPWRRPWTRQGSCRWASSPSCLTCPSWHCSTNRHQKITLFVRARFLPTTGQDRVQHRRPWDEIKS